MNANAFHIRMQAKQLENEAKKMQKEAQKERTKAKNELKRGNRACAELHAKNSVRYEQQARDLLQQVATLNGYGIDMRSATVSSGMANNLHTATKSMSESMAKTNIHKVAAQKEKHNALKDKIGSANKIVSGQEDNLVKDETVSLVSQLEQENEADALIMCDIPQSMPTSEQLPQVAMNN